MEKVDIIVEQSYKYRTKSLDMVFYQNMFCIDTHLDAKLPLFCQTYSRAALLQFLTLISPSFSVLFKHKYLNAVFVMVGPEVQNYLLLTPSSSFQSSFQTSLTLSMYSKLHLL